MRESMLQFLRAPLDGAQPGADRDADRTLGGGVDPMVPAHGAG